MKLISISTRLKCLFWGSGKCWEQQSGVPRVSRHIVYSLARYALWARDTSVWVFSEVILGPAKFCTSKTAISSAIEGDEAVGRWATSFLYLKKKKKAARCWIFIELNYISNAFYLLSEVLVHKVGSPRTVVTSLCGCWGVFAPMRAGYLFQRACSLCVCTNECPA